MNGESGEKDGQQQKQTVSALFDTVAPGYDNAASRFFPFCADQIVDLLKPRPGQKVLDVATGTGAVAVALAQALRPGGRVIGIDLSEGMLARAGENINKMALDNVDLFQMDAEHLQFKRDYFDASVCSFGMFFMPHMDKSMREIVRVTKPGGTVLLTSFAASAFQPMRREMFAELERFGIASSHLHMASDRLTTIQDCLNLMGQAGLGETVVREKQLGYHLLSAEDWWTIIWNSGSRRLIDRLSADQRAQFKIKHTAEIQKLATDTGIWMDVKVLFSCGVVK